MEVVLSPELVALVERQIATGRYGGSADEVVREALLLLERIDGVREELLDDLRREVAIGIDQLDRGEAVDADVVFARLRERVAALKTGA